MAVYNYAAVADTSIAFENGITLQQGRALRDNPIAAFEGQSGAPRLVGAAIAETIAGDTIQRNCLAFGDETVLSPNEETISRSVPQSAMTAMVDCTVRLFLSSTGGGGGGGTASITVLKNGTVIQTYGAVTGATLDVALLAGDTLGVAMSATGTVSTSASATLTALQYRVSARSAVMT